MPLQIDAFQIEKLMKSFYTMSGIRFVLFDTDYKEIIAYPKESCEFCKLMKTCSKTRRKCNNNDRKAFLKCENTNSPVIYKCHAGLVESVIPLHENENIIGYLMFGQIVDNSDKKDIYQKTNEWSEKYGFNQDILKEEIDKITYKTESEIQSAASIMEACTSYIIYKELIIPKSSKIITAAKEYIENNLGEDINSNSLCEHLNISRTRLYEIFRNELKMGISEYITIRRLHKAKKMLKTTDISISEIARKVGFTDYNYFSKVYKKRYGKSPRYYRK